MPRIELSGGITVVSVIIRRVAGNEDEILTIPGTSVDAYRSNASYLR